MRRITGLRHVICRRLSTAAPGGDSQNQKLHRIADDLLSLTKPELEDYTILLRHKLGFPNLISSANLSSIDVSTSASDPSAAVEEEKEEKTAFDVKLEKFEAAAKIKVIKEVRAFTDLGLKEAKELVEKAPVVVKKGVIKEEAEAIVKKLMAIGAKAALE